MLISVIIPVFNEASTIGKTVAFLRSLPGASSRTEIIVVDGGSSDDSTGIAAHAGAVVLKSKRKARSVQMNHGARHARGAVLYFLHADSLPPVTLVNDIETAFRNGFSMGCYRLQFDHPHWFLRLNAWFTRFDVNAFRFGDQSLFVNRDCFFKAGAFDERLVVMEDQEIIKRIRKHGRFTIIRKNVVTSARKYIVNGFFRMQAIFLVIFLLYKAGFSQELLVTTFRKLAVQEKL